MDSDVVVLDAFGMDRAFLVGLAFGDDAGYLSSQNGGTTSPSNSPPTWTMWIRSSTVPCGNDRFSMPTVPARASLATSAPSCLQLVWPPPAALVVDAAASDTAVAAAAQVSVRVNVLMAGSPPHHRGFDGLAGDLCRIPAAGAVLRVLGDHVAVDVEDVDRAPQVLP